MVMMLWRGFCVAPFRKVLRSHDFPLTNEYLEAFADILCLEISKISWWSLGCIPQNAQRHCGRRAVVLGRVVSLVDAVTPKRAQPHEHFVAVIAIPFVLVVGIVCCELRIDKLGHLVPKSSCINSFLL